MRQDHARWSDGRAPSNFWSAGGDGFHFSLGCHGARGTIRRRWLAELAGLDDMLCPRSERFEHGVELDHTFEGRTSTLGTDHDGHVSPSRSGYLALIADETCNVDEN